MIDIESRHRIEPLRRRGRVAVLASVLAALALASGTAGAQPGVERDARLDLPERQGRAQMVQNGPVSLDEAVAIARMRYEGRVVRAETRTVNGREVHVIRILSNGRVRDVQIDAATGRIRG